MKLAMLAFLYCGEFHSEKLFFMTDLCNDGLRRPSWDDVGKLTPHIDYDEEENIIEDIDYDNNDDVNEFKTRDGFSKYPRDYDENDDNIGDDDDDDDDNDEIDDSEMMITNKINDKFDVSSHGRGVDYPQGSTASFNRNMTSSKPAEKKVPIRRHNDVKGKESDVGKAKGNLQIKAGSKRSKERSGANSQSSFSVMSAILLPIYTLFLSK